MKDSIALDMVETLRAIVQELESMDRRLESIVDELNTANTRERLK